MVAAVTAVTLVGVVTMTSSSCPRPHRLAPGRLRAANRRFRRGLGWRSGDDRSVTISGPNAPALESEHVDSPGAGMAEGLVKWFNVEKGYGFLMVLGYAPGDIRVGNQEVFVHYPDIQMTGYRTLDEGAYVSFAIERDAKGNFKARQVTPLGGPPPSHLMESDAMMARSPRTMLVFLFVIVIILIVVIRLL